MKEYVPAIAAVIAGIFAIISAVVAWRLKRSGDEFRDKISNQKERHLEAKELYAKTIQLFEEAIKTVLNRDPFTLSREFSENTARIQLLAPKGIIDQYVEAASLLENWSVLHEKSNPRQFKVGEKTVTMLEAPDPTAKYKEPVNKEHEKLIDALQNLTKRMRNELGEA